MKFSSYRYKEIQSGVVAKSYMRKGFIIYEKRRKYFPIYEGAITAPFSMLHFFISVLCVFRPSLQFWAGLPGPEEQSTHSSGKYTFIFILLPFLQY
jgi:hypothetical protein